MAKNQDASGENWTPETLVLDHRRVVKIPGISWHTPQRASVPSQTRTDPSRDPVAIKAPEEDQEQHSTCICVADEGGDEGGMSV